MSFRIEQHSDVGLRLEYRQRRLSLHGSVRRGGQGVDGDVQVLHGALVVGLALPGGRRVVLFVLESEGDRTVVTRGLDLCPVVIGRLTGSQLPSVGECSPERVAAAPASPSLRSGVDVRIGSARAQIAEGVMPSIPNATTDPRLIPRGCLVEVMN